MLPDIQTTIPNPQTNIPNEEATTGTSSGNAGTTAAAQGNVTTGNSSGNVPDIDRKVPTTANDPAQNGTTAPTGNGNNGTVDQATTQAANPGNGTGDKPSTTKCVPGQRVQPSGTSGNSSIPTNQIVGNLQPEQPAVPAAYRTLKKHNRPWRKHKKHHRFRSKARPSVRQRKWRTGRRSYDWLWYA